VQFGATFSDIIGPASFGRTFSATRPDYCL